MTRIKGIAFRALRKEREGERLTMNAHKTRDVLDTKWIVGIAVVYFIGLILIALKLGIQLQ